MGNGAQSEEVVSQGGSAKRTHYSLGVHIGSVTPSTGIGITVYRSNS